MSVNPQGARIGPYPLLGVLGEGAFGIVYRVRDEKTGQERALKWMRSVGISSPVDRLGFRREIDLSRALSHPNLIAVLDVGEHGGFPYYVMELVDGPSLDRVIASRPPGRIKDAAWWSTVARLGTPLFDTLHYVHDHAIVHRDLKPQNIFVDSHGHPRLGDFGLAISQEIRAARSASGMVVGSFSYMAPELLLGPDADRRSDMFSLGLILYELISGRLPYPEDSILAAWYDLKRDGVLPLRQMEPSASAELEAVMTRLCAFDPEDRYFTLADAGRDWIAALRQMGHDIDLPAPASHSVMVPALVARERDLARLDEHLAAIREGGAHLVVVRGGGGTGKSRLVSHWLRHAANNCAVVRGSPRGPDDPPYEAFREMLREASKIATPEQWDFCPIIQDLLNDVESTHPESELHDEIRLLLRGLSEPQHPVVVSLDDAHWMDAHSVDLLSSLCNEWWFRPDRSDLKPALVILSMRPEAGEETPLGRWLSKVGDRLVRVDLEDLSPPAAERLAGRALGLGERPLPAGLAAALAETAGGNPFRLLQTLQAFLDAGFLTLEGTVWVFDAAACRA